MLKDEDEDYGNIGITDLIALIKAEGVYIQAGKDGTLLIHPGNLSPRDDVIEVAQLYADDLIEWLSMNSFFDA